MKIVASELRMDASTGYREVREQTGGIGRNPRISSNDGPSFQLPLPDPAMAMTIGTELEAHVVQSSLEARSIVKVGDISGESAFSRQKVLASAVGEILGRQIRVGDVIVQDREQSWQTAANQERTDRLDSPARSPFAMIFNRLSLAYTYEKVSVASSGHVATADGRTIDFSLDLSLERQDLSISSRAGQVAAGILLDPLVLSFTDGLDVLAETAFFFDLNGDGRGERIAGLGRCSGFLGIDLNGDNRFNDGTELFGPRTGFAFDELRAYDGDGNNWIDENDPVFAKLGLWMEAGGENARLVGLREAGVGALALASTENQFSLKNSTGRVVGRIDRSGLFLMEDGAVRSLQEIDLAAGPAGKEGLEERPQSLETVSQALAVLQRLILVRRRQLEHLTLLRFAGHRQARAEKRLAEKFWEWQENGWGGTKV